MTSEVEFHDLDVGDPDGRLGDPLLVVIVPLTSVWNYRLGEVMRASTFNAAISFEYAFQGLEKLKGGRKN
jgi:hypothetical protein